jgi:hypothetical protein
MKRVDLTKAAKGFDVEFIIPATEDQALRYIGDRCHQYYSKCYACMAWRKWDKTGNLAIQIPLEDKFFDELFQLSLKLAF